MASTVSRIALYTLPAISATKVQTLSVASLITLTSALTPDAIQLKRSPMLLQKLPSLSTVPSFGPTPRRRARELLMPKDSVSVYTLASCALLSAIVASSLSGVSLGRKGTCVPSDIVIRAALSLSTVSSLQFRAIALFIGLISCSSLLRSPVGSSTITWNRAAESVEFTCMMVTVPVLSVSTYVQGEDGKRGTLEVGEVGHFERGEEMHALLAGAGSLRGGLGGKHALLAVAWSQVRGGAD
eukprot:scaffold18065_cov111-Isochrysis_galbana.AAC.5